MSASDKRRDWSQRYRDSDCLFGDQPSALLTGNRHLLQPGQRALAIADGEGRNGLWLAARGLSVTTLDRTPEAVARARAAAAQRRLEANILCVDLFDWTWPAAAFDVVALIFLHLPPEQRQQLFRLIDHTLRPGGLLLLEGYRDEQADMDSGGPGDPALFYNRALLRQAFRDYRMLTLEDTLTDVVSDGEYRGKGAIVHMVARKASP